MSNLSFQNLRIYIDSDVHPIYIELTKGTSNSPELNPFQKMTELYVAAACFGAKSNVFKPIAGKKKDIFYADSLDPKTHIPVLVALAYKQNPELDTLTDPKKILTTCEGWANSGIHILHNLLERGEGLSPLSRLVDEIIT